MSEVIMKMHTIKLQIRCGEIRTSAIKYSLKTQYQNQKS